MERMAGMIRTGRQMLVGLIANPEAGHDVRRVVSHASTFSNQEKVHIIRRVLMGIRAAGVERVVYLPEPVGLVSFALEGLIDGPTVEPLEMTIFGRATDSTRAAEQLVALGAGCIVTLGGDGTNRVVAKGSGEVPLVPISTGTNNVFPTLIEGTIAGLAAGVVAGGRLDGQVSQLARRRKRIEVRIDGELREIALVDAAVTREPFVGSRAVWDPGQLDELLLTQAQPDAIGLSAVGGQLDPLQPNEMEGLLLEIGSGGREVLAAIAPGMVRTVQVARHRRLQIGDGVSFEGRRGTIALDGEREIEVYPRMRVELRLSASGPRVVDIPAAMRAAAEAGLFRSRASRQ
jgi:predicted polyphosphate/ATP-dependent NAD kinase